MSFLRSDETKVLLILGLVLGSLELGARVFEGNLSKDVKHIRSLPAVAAELKVAPKEQLKVLILGNSLSRHGLDKTMLQEGLEKLTGRQVTLAAMTPDGSNIGQWFYGYRRYFDQTESLPDLVFMGTGRPHLLDGASAADRLAAFYTSFRDMPRLLREQSGDVEAISEALTARYSMLFAHRGRVQPLVFYNLVPGYTETTQTLAVRRETTSPTEKTEADHGSETCRTFASLMETMQAKHTRAIVVAIPMTVPYAIPDCVLKSAQAAKMPVLNAGASVQYEPALFPDGYHLDEKGAAIFTRSLLDVLAQRPECLEGLSK